MLLKHMINYLTTLFAITNPFGNLAIFIALTGHKSQSGQRHVALVTAFTVAIILTIITWVGQPILDFLNISVASFQLAGALVITLIGLSMLHSKKTGISHTDSEQKAAESKDSVAVVPLSIPIIAGPGAITAVLLASHQYPSTIARLTITGCNLLIAAIIALVFFFAGPISRVLGEAGLKIAVRITGLILVAMAMGMLVAGLTTAFPALAHG